MTHYIKKNDDFLLQGAYERIAYLPRLRWEENNEKDIDERGNEK